MPTLKITVLRIVNHQDLSNEYENKLDNPCPYKLGDSFIITSLDKPDNLCDAAWRVMYPYIETLFRGGSCIYGNWMKNKKSAMVSCDDGFRPVSFYIEVVE